MKAVDILSMLSLSRPVSISLEVMEQGAGSDIVISGGSCGGGV